MILSSMQGKRRSILRALTFGYLNKFVCCHFIALVFCSHTLRTANIKAYKTFYIVIQFYVSEHKDLENYLIKDEKIATYVYL